MSVYKIKEHKLELVEQVIFNTEKEIQNLVENNVEEIFNLKLVSSEYRVGEFRFDTVCYDNETNSFVIIEYKKDNSFSIIDQGFSYLATMLERKSDFILDYNELSGEKLKKNEVDWSQSKIIFISPSFTVHQRNSINFKDMPFELWEIKKFSNDIINFNQFLSSSKESIKNISISKNKDISLVNEELKSFDEEELLLSSTENVKELWKKIHDRINQSDFLGTKIKTTKTRVRFCSMNNQVICYFYFRSKYILINIMSGTIYGDKSKGKYFAEIDDPNNMTKKITHIWKGYGNKHKEKFGTDKDPVNISYNFKLNDENEINYFIGMIKNRYLSVTDNG